MVKFSAPQKSRRKIAMDAIKRRAASPKTVSKVAGITRMTTWRLTNKVNSGETYVRKEGSGRPGWSKQQEGWLVEIIKNNRHFSVREVAEALENDYGFKRDFSVVNKKLSSLKWKKMAAIRKPFLSEQNKVDRVSWGLAWRDRVRWEKVIISDEACFKLEDRSGMAVWKHASEEITEAVAALPRRVKARSGIGFLTWFGAPPLKILEGGVKAQDYRDAVVEMVQWLENQGAEGSFYLLEDNSPIHKSSLMREY